MKKGIGIIIMILIIIVIIITYILINSKKEEKEEEGLSAYIPIENECVIKNPNDRSMYFALKPIINKYINYIIDNESSKLMNIVSEEYIDEESITSNNVVEKIKDEEIEYNENYEIIIKKAYFAEESEIIKTYFVDLLYFNIGNNQKYTTKLMIQLDPNNMTFRINSHKYMKNKGYDKLKIGDTYSAKITDIKNKNDNKYTMIPISKNSMSERLFNIYLDYLKYDKEQSYYLLNEEYREKRFKNTKTYMEYLNEIDVNNIRITKYVFNEFDDYTQYVCIDNNGNYYIFTEKGVMDFDVILDTYTLDVPEFLEKYNSTNEQGKCALNIQKFMQAINAKDYNYAYNCLSDGFKSNYFNTIEKFKEYIIQNFYTNNKVLYEKFSSESTAYTYKIQLKNNDYETSSTIEKTFIIKLRRRNKF